MLQLIETHPHNSKSMPHGYNAQESEAMQRACLRLFSLWGISDKDAAVLVGGISPKTLQRWRKQEYSKLSIDQGDRLSNLLAIHKALRVLFREPKQCYQWISKDNKAFVGASALQVMLRGHLHDIARVRYYLDSVRGGW